MPWVYCPCTRRGAFLQGLRTVVKPKSVIERMQAKTVVDEVTGCWLFNGARNQNGHGNISVKIDGKHKTRRPHQISYEAHFGPIPKGKVVRHRCDVPNCWNPEHLVIGDHYQNMRDMMERNRGRNQFTSLKDLGIEVPEESCPF